MTEMQFVYNRKKLTENLGKLLKLNHIRTTNAAISGHLKVLSDLNGLTFQAIKVTSTSRGNYDSYIEPDEDASASDEQVFLSLVPDPGWPAKPSLEEVQRMTQLLEQE